jgi:hypothetical protein
MTDGTESPWLPKGSSVLPPAPRNTSSDGTTRGAVSEPPAVLPGPAGATLLLNGWRYEIAGFLAACLLSIESYFPGRWYYWGTPILALALSLVLIGFVTTLRGNRRLADEKRLGYTTALGDASEDPSLYYVDRVSLRVVAGPHQPRPRHRKSR